MTTRKQIIYGGFRESSDIWNHSICKTIIQKAELNPGPEVLRNHRKCLIFLSLQLNPAISPEDLYNKITPMEYVEKIGKRNVFNSRTKTSSTGVYGGLTEKWQSIELRRNAAIAKGGIWGTHPDLQLKELPGKEVTSVSRSASRSISRSASKKRSSSRNKL